MTRVVEGPVTETGRRLLNQFRLRANVSGLSAAAVLAIENEAAQAARAEVIAEIRAGLDFEALRQAIDSDEFAAEVGVAGAFEHWETVRIAEVIATGYKLALLPPTEPKP